jgi:hypothetical protein
MNELSVQNTCLFLIYKNHNKIELNINSDYTLKKIEHFSL